MANPIAKDGTHYRQERYNDAIVPLMRKELNVRNEFSRDFEGSPVSGAVKVPVRATDPTIAEYDVSAGADLTQSATTYLNVPVDNHFAINEIIDGYEADAVPDNLKAQRLEAGAYALGRKLELNAIAELEAEGTYETSTTALTNETAYKAIKDTIITMKGLGMRTEDLVGFVSADTEALLLEDDMFANSAGTLGAELLRDGVIGKIAGVNIKPSYNLSATTEYVVFDKRYTQAIDEWKINLGINNLGNTFIGASALQGRIVFADAVTNSDAVRIKSTATPSA